MFLRLSAMLTIVIMLMAPPAVVADTYVIPFSEIRQAADASDDPPDAAIRAHLATFIRNELDALGFDISGGLVFGEIPIEEMTRIIETDCDFPQPYEVHTDATTATVLIDDGSSLTLDLDSIRAISLLAELTGTVSTTANAWVRWGQDIPFGDDCVKFDTDHGRVSLTLPFDISLELALELTPAYDSERLAIVVDKQATVAGRAVINGGKLEHDFGAVSLTDLVLSVFEDELLQSLQTEGEQAVANAIAKLNYRLDGLDDNGVLDPTLTAFNAPTIFALDVSEEDQASVRALLEQYGIPDIVIAMLEERAIEVLLQLVILDGAARDAYLAALGASASCDVLLAAFQTDLDAVPLYTLNGQTCEVADLSGAHEAGLYADALCTEEIAYRSTDDAEFCLTALGDQAEALLGNAASWAADSNQPNDPLPDVPSRGWTTVPGTQLDLGVLPLQGNHQPYMKQLRYKSVTDVPRGNGTCELEMRVYKKDVAADNLKPLIALHGGTWRHRGSSFLGLEAGISHFTERGFVVFAPFYRLAGESDGNVECNAVTWREITADVESALDWVRDNGAALGSANGPVSVYGQSAGAHLAAWLAAHRPGDVRKALIYYGPTDALEFLQGAIPLGGPYEAFRDFGLTALSRFFGAPGGQNELRLTNMTVAGLTVEQLRDDWATLIPATVFDLSLLNPQMPPLYVERCAAATQIDLNAINLSVPPVALTDCLKADLRDFLIDNSFNHLLSDEGAPVHAVNGTADTLVPYAQALNLCGAIDGGVFATDVTEPLTTYACGEASEVQLVKDAEHALELGVCAGALCPAGEIDSPTRAAVATAIEASYAWLLQDPPAPEPDPPAIADEPDAGGGGAMVWWPLFGLLLFCRQRVLAGSEVSMKLPARRKFSSIVFVSVWFAVGIARADMAGSADYEGLPRVAGSEIIGYHDSGYDAGTLLVEGDDQPITLAQPEGARTRIVYLNAEGNTPLMVLKNYETALADIGTVNKQFECREAACNNHLIATNLWTRERMVPEVDLQHPFYLLGFAHVFDSPAYLHAQVTSDGKLLHVGVLSARLAQGNANSEIKGRVVTLVEIVEAEEFEATLEFVDAAEMQNQIGTAGHVALYGIQFDHDKASLRPESVSTIAEIVKVLTADSALAIYVVGHTDDVGALAYNQSLSLRRAQAVVSALVAEGVDETRLTALGVGPAAPVGRNDTENGRALNRRVEIVKRGGS